MNHLDMFVPDLGSVERRIYSLDSTSLTYLSIDQRSTPYLSYR
jgi:hypothetical protein